MRLELREDGRLVLCEVTEEAWNYILSEREKLEDPEHQCWYFGKTNHKGTVYIGTTDAEEKTEFIALIDRLNDRFGLDVLKSAERLLNAWRAEALNVQQVMIANLCADNFKIRYQKLKLLLIEGCSGCRHLFLERNGDDVNGFCKVKGARLDVVTEVSFASAGGIFQPKFIPCESCFFLNE